MVFWYGRLQRPCYTDSTKFSSVPQAWPRFDVTPLPPSENWVGRDWKTSAGAFFMSISLMSEVWRRDFSHIHQSIMLALADWGQDDGSGVFPSVRRVAWKTGYSERQIKRIMAELRKIGALVVVKRHRDQPTEYRIDLTAVAEKPPFKYTSSDKLTPPPDGPGYNTGSGPGDTTGSGPGDTQTTKKSSDSCKADTNGLGVPTANRLVEMVMEHGLNGARPPDWAKQSRAAARLVEHFQSEDQMEEHVRAMRSLYAFSDGQPFDGKLFAR